MSTVRTFVAVALPDELKASLVRVQQMLRPDLPASWSRPDTMHITLHFIGDVESRQAEHIAAALQETAAGFAPFVLRARGLGVFPNPRRPRVLWVGIDDPEPLVDLQRALRDPLRGCGVTPDEKDYRPHLTLARFRKPLQRQPLSFLRVILRDEQRDLGDVTVTEVRLYRSELHPSGAVHTVLATAALTRA